MNLPAGQGVTLRLWWYMLTVETTHPRDTLDVSVKFSGGQEVGVLHITDGDTPSAWQQAVIDLSSYAGQSVRIKFRATTDANRPTTFYVDDVSVQTCTGGTDTSTPSVTHTPSASVSPSREQHERPQGLLSLTDEHINTQGAHLLAAHFEVARHSGDVARASWAFHLQPCRLIRYLSCTATPTSTWCYTTMMS